MADAIDLTQRFRASDQLLSSQVEDELVMLDIDRGEYFGLNAVGSFLWEQLAEPTTGSELSERLIEAFEVDSATSEADVAEFLQSLLERGLIAAV